MKKTAVVAVFILAVMAVAAKAQSDTKYSVSLLDGAAIPVSGLWHSNSANIDGHTYDMSAKTSAANALAVDYKLNSNIAVGMEIGRSWAHTNDLILESGGTVAIGQYTPYVKVSKQMGKLTPYGILGAGLYTVSAESLPVLEEYYDGLGYGRSYGYFGFNAGLGATYALGGGFEIGIDARWHHVCSNFAAFDFTTPDFSVTQIAINNITPSLKIQYDFNL
jgi:hypothetical protein